MPEMLTYDSSVSIGNGAPKWTASGSSLAYRSKIGRRLKRSKTRERRTVVASTM